MSRDKTHIFKLTNREQEVYELLLKGFTQKKISEILGTKLSSIQSYAHIIYEKKGVSGVKELIEVANG